MRVTGGEYRGQILTCPRRAEVRPTEDRVRQGLFNVLGSAVVHANILDMFAGTGSLGIEALSRGAAYSLFIEKNAAVAKTLRANLERLPVEQGSYRILVGDALKLPEKIADFPTGFDLVFVDPPYEAGLYEPAIAVVAEKRLLRADGILVLEYAVRRPVPEPGRDWQRLKTRVYGETALDFWRFLPGKEE